MAIVTVKRKYQVVIPQRVREQVGVHVGDLLEAKVDNGKIVFTPKSLVDPPLLKDWTTSKRAASTGLLTVLRK